ncbi:MAG: hypothetical protein QT10_C0007G0029 [archaeon GW2011_AR19]|nr:MAG: hypothetical protein QT10_C0007G0029 [archaeon GW2011_AR19]
MEKISINKNALVDLVRLKEEFDSVVESIELMNDKKFMESLIRSKKQIKNREFSDWNEL